MKLEKVGYACRPASADAGWQARYATFPRPHYVWRYDFDIFQQVSYLDIEIPDVFEIPLVWHDINITQYCGCHEAGLIRASVDIL